jgi:flagellar protein FliO/FliZ
MPDLSAGAALATYVLAAAGVLVLLGIVLWFARRSNGGEIARKMAPARRLAVIDQIALDEKRRLVLIQRDGVEHLVILGGANELLVESGIGDARASRFNERELRAPAREVQELPAFPAAPAREAPPLAAPSVAHAGRQPALAEPTPPAFSEPPRRPAAVEAPAPLRPASPLRSEPSRPQPPAPAPIPRRADPLPPVVQAAPAAQSAPAVPPVVQAPPVVPAPAVPPVPPPVLRAESEPVRAVEAALAALAPSIEPETAPEPETSTTKPTKAGGLLARLRGPRQSETAVPTAAASEPVLAPLRDPEPSPGEPRLGGLSQPDVLPEMPTHSVPDVVLDPPAALEPESQGTTPAAARVEPDMSKLFDMIVPEPPAAPARPAAPAAPVPAAPVPAVPVPAAPVPAAATPVPPVPAAPSPAAATPPAPSLAARMASEEPPAGDSAEVSRVAVRIDPFFANMAQRLEETLRRPIAATPSAATPAPPPLSATPAKLASNAAEIERAIDLALGASDEPGKAAPTTPAAAPAASPPAASNAPAPRAPQVAPPTQDELEAEMANLLGRGHR